MIVNCSFYPRVIKLSYRFPRFFALFSFQGTYMTRFTSHFELLAQFTEHKQTNSGCFATRHGSFMIHMVGLSGLEPPTSRLSGVRSNLLSYKPI